MIFSSGQTQGSGFKARFLFATGNFVVFPSFSLFLLILRAIATTQSIRYRGRRLRWAAAISRTWAPARSEANSTHLAIRPATRPTWRAPTTLSWPDRTRAPVSTLTNSKCAPTTRPSFTGTYRSHCQKRECRQSSSALNRLLLLLPAPTDPTAKRTGSRFTTSFPQAERYYSAATAATRSPDRWNPSPGLLV